MPPKNPSNVVQQQGFLTRACEIVEYEPGKLRAYLDLAQVRYLPERDADGRWKRNGEVEFFRYQAWGEKVEQLRHLERGQDVYVTGVLSQDRSKPTGRTYTKLLLFSADPLKALDWADYRDHPPSDPVSRFVLQGRVTRPLKIEATEGGLKAEIPLAFNRFSREKDAGGNYKAYPAEFFHPFVSDDLAQECSKLPVGAEVLVTGQLRMDRTPSGHTWIRMDAYQVEPVVHELENKAKEQLSW